MAQCKEEPKIHTHQRELFIIQKVTPDEVIIQNGNERHVSSHSFCGANNPNAIWDIIQERSNYEGKYKFSYIQKIWIPVIIILKKRTKHANCISNLPCDTRFAKRRKK